MEKILPLEEELDGIVLSWTATGLFDIGRTVLAEFGDGADPTPIAKSSRG